MIECAAPAVTVAIAAYNAVPFVSRAITSALTQVGVSLEVIVVDDASADGTAQYVQTQFGADPRVRVVALSKNGGPAVSRNVAFAQAKGQWLAILDADDAFQPSHLSQLVALGESENASIVAGNFVYFDVHGSVSRGLGLTRRPGIEYLDRYTFVEGARPYTEEADFGLLKPLFRTHFLRSHDLSYPVDVRHGEDMELILEALLKGAKYVIKRDLCSYLYTTRDSGHSRTPVNYGAQVERTLSIKRRPDVRGDKELLRLLTQRASALQRLELDRNWTQKTMSRRNLAWMSIRSAAGRRWLLSRTTQKLVG